MTTFQDGPAKGQTLMLQRACYFLRVTESAGVFDALDQLGDEPRQDETIHAYVMVGKHSWVHIRKKGGGGFFSMAEYRLVPVQPTDAEMRTFEAWSVWCHNNVPDDWKKT